MEAHRPWLAQGDIFRAVPVLEIEVLPSGQAVASLPTGPAVLLTHDCAMDKAYSDGRPKYERLQFARLRATAGLPQERRANLQGSRGAVAPFEAMWLGEVGDLGESFLLLSDTYFLPVECFRLLCVQYEEAAGNGPNTPRATPQVIDTRFARLSDDQLNLLRRKMLAYWTRLQPE